MSEALRFPWGNERPPRRDREVSRPPAKSTPGSGQRRDSRVQGRPIPRGRSGGTATRNASRSVSSTLARPRALGTGWSGGLTPGGSAGRAEPTSSRSSDRDAARDRLPGRVIEGPSRIIHEPDYVLLLAAVALSSIGILMILSSEGVDVALRTTGSVVDAVIMQLVWAVTGGLVLVVTTRMDYRILRHLSVGAMIVAVVLLILVLLPPVAPLMERKVVGGSARWLSVLGLPTFHPAELAKLALVVYLAHWLASRGTRIRSLREGTIPFLLLAGPVIALVALEPDLGTTGVITLMAFTMFFVAGANLWHLAMLVPVGIGAVAFALRSYQMDRIETFLDPWKVASQEGYQTVQGILSLGLGGLFGTGLGESNPHAGGISVPNSANDFIFAIVGQELGLVGGLTVIVLFLVLAWRGVRVAMGAPDTFGALLALGVTSWIAFQAFINIGVVVHLLPLTGVPLPFVSDGGSSLIVSLAAVGILLAISRETSRGSQTDELTVAAGGTGGHIYPALAVVRRLSATRADVAVGWIGGHRGLERELVPEAGLPLTRLWLRSLRTVDLSLETVLDPLRLAASVPQAVLVLRRLRPDVIYLTGGYIAIPVLMAASLLRIPTLLWEGNRLAGRSVRATARLATLRAVTFDGTRAQLPEPSFVTGTPIRDLGDADRGHARTRLGLPPDGDVILVFGGSQASRRLNTAVSEAIAELVTRSTVLHITGAEGFAAAEADRDALPEPARDRYRPIAFLGSDMDAALVSADLLVGRAGSSTIAETAAYGLPLVVVPYPHAAAHQRANAAQIVDAGGATLVADEDFDGAALLRAADLLGDPRIEAMRAASRALARPGAAEATVQLLEALAQRRALPSPAGLEALTREAA